MDFEQQQKLAALDAVMAQNSCRVHIRWMIRRDMKEVLSIEQEAFDSPWDEEDFVRCLRQRNCIGMVCELNERVVGFVIYGLYKNKLDILNVAVEKEYQRRSIGGQIMEKLKKKLSHQRRRKIQIHVGDHNLPMHLFLQKHGFHATSIARRYYDDRDAYLFEYSVESQAEPAMPINRIRKFMNNKPDSDWELDV